MSRIVDAKKVEIIRDLVIEEYNANLTFRMDANGSGNIAISLPDDPRVEARNRIRKWANEQDVENDAIEFRAALLAKLDEYDTATQMTWGKDKGKQLPYSTTVWLDASILRALVDMFSANDMSNDVRTTIREALSGTTTDTKGF